MTGLLRDAFADTSYWIALVVRQDQSHSRAQQWSLHVTRQIVTTSPVLLETANALSRPAWRTHAVDLISHLRQRSDVEIVDLSAGLWDRGWDLYSCRKDQSWSLTDCISFRVMEEVGLTAALTADEHFRQAGFRALLLEEP